MGNTHGVLDAAYNCNYEQLVRELTNPENEPETVNVCDYWGRNALHQVCYSGDHNLPVGTSPEVREMIAEYLINNGINFQAQDDDGNAPLHYACKKNRVELVKLLLKNFANVNIKNNQGMTPLHVICRQHHTNYESREELVKVLVKAGADLYAKDKEGHTPIYWANWRGYTKMYQYLKTIKENKKVKKQDIMNKKKTVTQTNPDIIQREFDELLKDLPPPPPPFNAVDQELTQLIETARQDIQKEEQQQKGMTITRNGLNININITGDSDALDKIMNALANLS